MNIIIGVFRVATCFDVEEWFHQMLERSVQADCKLRRDFRTLESNEVSRLTYEHLRIYGETFLKFDLTSKQVQDNNKL
ncbi:hypothetical protein H5410_037710 [Solanum commersonii]|uniref:Uncharacterized protein n=1 Tax=Solanum commersonii TaxID=4109 RepID=A0A9J5YBX7_SOLCO|nr:hypothetical protein H5410_037710 [Solanum commersonii]